MALALLSPLQEAIADALRHWCDAEGIAHQGQLILRVATPTHSARSLIQLTLGDTVLWIAEDGVTVELFGRRMEIGAPLDASCKDVVRAVIAVLESG